MAAIKHILIPTDGSEDSLKAARAAGDLARALKAKVSVLLVQDERSIISEAWNASAGAAGKDSALGSVATVRESMEKDALECELADTRDAVGELPEGIQLVQMWGHPSDAICRYASECGADLIVMGSHGRSALKRAILGSVSHAVVNSAPCGVTIIR